VDARGAFEGLNAMAQQALSLQLEELLGALRSEALAATSGQYDGDVFHSAYVFMPAKLAKLRQMLVRSFILLTKTPTFVARQQFLLWLKV